MKNSTIRKQSSFARWALLLAAAAIACTPSSSMLIVNVDIVDGTGAAARSANVLIQDGRVVAINSALSDADSVFDGAGLVLAPGFIDTHSHHDGGIEEDRTVLAAVSQGITTIVVGQDGGSRYPLRDFFTDIETTPVAVNIASYVGHNSLRRIVMADDYERAATNTQIDSMVSLLKQELQTGALGLSTGLEYDPGIYSETHEVISLARITADSGGRYISHLRSEDRFLWTAVEEIIEIGTATGMPVQISHMKLAMRSLWGAAPRLIDRLERARSIGVEITADVYPYEFWQSTMTVLFPDRNFDDRDAVQFALDELAPPEGIILGAYAPNPSYVGKTMAEIAENTGTDAVSTYIRLMEESQAWQDSTGQRAESIVARSMTWDDISHLIAWPHTNISSDGSLRSLHPRGFGSFPRVLARMVRRDSVLDLEAAIHRMTGLAARHMGINNRGTIEIGSHADLVLIDPNRVADRATTDDPWAVSVGIEHVWVNGTSVYTNGTTTGKFPGHIIRRARSDS